VAASIEEALAYKIQKTPGQPTLGILQVGSNSSSNTYIRQKTNTAKRLGVTCQLIQLPATSEPSQIRDVIKEWNNSANITGYIIQLPLPNPHSTQELLNLIAPDKDADALSAINLGRMLQNNAVIIPATARGVM